MTELRPLVTEYVHSRMPDHEKVKERLLKLIEVTPSHHISLEVEKVTRTDIDFMGTHRAWLPVFFDCVKPVLDEFAKLNFHKEWALHHTWYFHYEKGDYAHWHIHSGCAWTGVYFLDLPSPKLKTTLLKASNGTELSLGDVQEGDIIIFPSTVIHCSKLNLYDKPKTVIAFNADLYDSFVHERYPVQYYNVGE